MENVTEDFTAALADLILIMQQEGYKCCAPNRQIEEWDRNVLYHESCPRCRQQYAQHYEPFTQFDQSGQTKSYRPFAICKRCGLVREF